MRHMTRVGTAAIAFSALLSCAAAGAALSPAAAGPTQIPSFVETACSRPATAFLSSLIRKGLRGVKVITAEEPRWTDDGICMADYIAGVAGGDVEKSLTSYLRSLGYVSKRNVPHGDYITIVKASAAGLPAVELELPSPAEAPFAPAPFEILLADPTPGPTKPEVPSTPAPSPAVVRFASAPSPVGSRQACQVLVTYTGTSYMRTGSAAWQPTQTLISGYGLQSMATDGKRWVAVGGDGFALSHDGRHWQVRKIAESLQGVAFSGSSWVAVGLEGAIYRSSDALTWTRVKTTDTWNLDEVAFHGGTWVAVGDTGGGWSRGVALTSSDGATWHETYRFTNAVAGGDTLPRLGNISWVGTRWLALSSRIASAAGTTTWDVVGLEVSSTDGEHWTEREGTLPLASGVAAHGQELLALGIDNGVYRTSDAIQWSRIAVLPGNPGSQPTIAWDGTEWVASSAGAETYRSPDGVSWTKMPVHGGVAGVATGRCLKAPN
jgi:hypothetical protein